MKITYRARQLLRLADRVPDRSEFYLPSPDPRDERLHRAAVLCDEARDLLLTMADEAVDPSP